MMKVHLKESDMTPTSAPRRLEVTTTAVGDEVEMALSSTDEDEGKERGLNGRLTAG